MEWRSISEAPKDGTLVLLWSPKYGGHTCIGSFRVDEGFSGDERPQWLDTSYDDFSIGYASVPMSDATHFAFLPPPPTGEDG